MTLQEELEAEAKIFYCFHIPDTNRYFKKEINNNRGNHCKVWELLHSVLLCSNKKSSSFPSKLQFDGVKIDNPYVILECLTVTFAT